jgi:polyisoprenoid-binding protein YceI
MKITSFLLILLSFGITAETAAQKYITRSGRISFISTAPLEDIEGKNKSVIAALDSKTGAVQFSVTMKGFEFQKSKMQEHFNENYVESDKYPKAEFKGAITNNKDINYSKPGTYNAKVTGQLTLHGVSKALSTTGMITVLNDGIQLSSNFSITVADYKISIPAAVKNKVAKTVKVLVDAKLDPVK